MFSIEDWAHGLKKQDATNEYKKIPEDIDILLTHGPPFKYGSIMHNGKDIGCPHLLQRVQKIKPLAHIYGHIHEGYGVRTDGNTLFFNASSMSIMRKISYNPLVFDISKTN